MEQPTILTAALTGPVARKSDNPNLPCTPEEIAASAAEAHAAGAAVVHVHLRDEHGEPTADLEIAKRVLAAVEEATPVLVQLSTGVGHGVPLDVRARLVEARPRMASLNVASMTFGDHLFANPLDGVRRLAARMRELGIKPEIELYDTGHLELALMLLREGVLAEPLQFSFVFGIPGGMAATPANLLALIARVPPGSAWQAIGISRAHLQMTALGLVLGGNARTGMEDTLLLRRGVPAAGNGQLVERLAGIARAIERPIATVEEAAERLALEPVAVAR